MTTKHLMKSGKQAAVQGSDGQMQGSISLATPPVAEQPAVVIPDQLDGLEGKERLAAAQDQLISAINGIRNSKDFQEALDFAAKVHNYSLWNSVLLASEHRRRREIDPSIPADPGYFMSTTAWKKAGRYPLKGSTGYYVFAPVMSSGRYYELDGRKIHLAHKEKAPAGVEVKYGKKELVGYTVKKTHPEYLTGGDPVPQAPQPKLLEDGEIEGLTDAMETQAWALGFSVEYVPASELGGANGAMNPTTKSIRIRDDVSGAQRMKTLIHELAHAIHHSGDDFDYHGCRGMAETQAEGTAYLVVRMLGGDTSDYSVPYIAGWSSGMEAHEIRSTINAIGSAARDIVENFEATFAVDDEVAQAEMA